MNTLIQHWRAGFVRRWHQNPDTSHVDDYNHGHQGRCGVLVLSLWPECTKELLAAAVTHDLREIVTGDIAGPLKSEHPDAFAAMEHLGDAWEVRNGFAFVLSAQDKKRLKFVDRLDAYLLVKHRAPNLLSGDDWQLAHGWLIEVALNLGVSDKVGEL